MCARRFLMLIFILTLMFVGGAFALFQWGGQTLIRMATPVGHYQAPAKGTGPDYSKDEAWLAKPGFERNSAEWVPQGVISEKPSHPAATFYIHPTTYLERDLWNAPLELTGQPADRAGLFVQSQASAFNGISSVWAPKYRQAAFGAFLLKSEDADKALNLAYGDVLAAFDQFLRQNPMSDIILAGHSQGSLHLLRLLRDRKAALKGRLVAAYVVGWPVSVNADLPATGLAPCSDPHQSECVLSWQSFRQPDNTDMITDAWIGTSGLTGANRSRDDMLCTNPITGTKDGNAPASANRGTLLPNGDYSQASSAPGLVGARCDKGFLLIDGNIPNLGPYVLPGNNYHVYDFALFWGSVRADVERRVTAWRAH